MVSARTKAHLMLLAVSAIWGVAPPAIKYSLKYFDTSVFLSYRFLITNILLIPLLFIVEPQTWTTLSRLTVKKWLLLIMAGFLGSTVQLGLLFWGLENTSAIEGSIINATAPILVAIGCFFFLREKITAREKMGISVAFLGSAFVVIEPIFTGQYSASRMHFYGNTAVLLGTLVWAVYAILSKKALRGHVSPLLLTTAMFFIGGLTMPIITFFLHSPYSLRQSFLLAPFSAHLGVWFMAFISGALAYFLYQQATKYVEVSEANIYTYLSPVFTLPLSLFFLKEPVGLWLIVGSAIIVGGVLLSELKTGQRR